MASAWIRRISISARGDNREEGVGVGVATRLPELDPAVLVSAIDVAKGCLDSSDFG